MEEFFLLSDARGDSFSVVSEEVLNQMMPLPATAKVEKFIAETAVARLCNDARIDALTEARDLFEHTIDQLNADLHHVRRQFDQEREAHQKLAKEREQDAGKRLAKTSPSADAKENASAKEQSELHAKIAELERKCDEQAKSIVSMDGALTQLENLNRTQAETIAALGRTSDDKSKQIDFMDKNLYMQGNKIFALEQQEKNAREQIVDLEERVANQRLYITNYQRETNEQREQLQRCEKELADNKNLIASLQMRCKENSVVTIVRHCAKTTEATDASAPAKRTIWRLSVTPWQQARRDYYFDLPEICHKRCDQLAAADAVIRGPDSDHMKALIKVDEIKIEQD